MNFWRGTVKKFSLLLFLALGFSSLSLSLSGSVSAYDFSVTIPEGEILEVKLFNSDGVAMGSTTSMNVAPSSLSSAGFNEKNVIVSVATSNEWGYNLVMNIPNTNLVSKEDSSNTIPTLAPKDGGYTCTIQTAATCDFTVNHWGYKINTNTTTQTASNYLPIPTTINLNKNSTVTTGDTTSISFGSRINASQTPGTYQSTITFAVTANPDPTPIMQNVSASTLATLLPTSGSTATLKDSRDNNKYQITNINGTYWMTDNLKIMGTISASESNFTGADFNISAGGDLTLGDTYTEPRAHFNTSDANSTTYGAYYNYCAASAGTVCSSITVQDATVDICPKGWRLPTRIEAQAFANASSSNKNPVLAGYYYGGSPHYIGSDAHWWSATVYNAGNRYGLGYGTSWYVYGSGSNPTGASVRCIYGPLPPTMQNATSAKLAQLMPTDGSTTTLPDSRDGNVYNIARIGGTYWMTDNLRFTGTSLTPADTNVTQNTTMTYTDLKTLGNSYTSAGMHYNTTDANSTTYGAYYNYCAASAGTVCSQTKQNATQDICPKGWRLPTQTEFTTIANNNGTNFNPVFAGYYYSGALYDADSRAFWWSATAYGNNLQYGLYYYGSWLVFDINKDRGLSIRCIFSAT